MSSLEKLFGIDQSYDSSIAKEESVDYKEIVSWLIKEYFTVYYVNLANNNYVEYSSHDSFKHLDVEQSGKDFFNEGRRIIRKIIYPDDYERVISMFDRDHLLTVLEKSGAISITYRLIIDGNVTYVNAVADYTDDKKDHIFLSIKKVDNEMQWLKKYEESVKRNVTYSSIASSLAKDYFIIYYINIETDEFVEYSSNSDYQQLKVEKIGPNFFNVAQGLIFRLVHPDDTNKINIALSKDKIIQSLAKHKAYAVNFRIDYNGEYRYVRAKALKVDNNDKFIVIGVSDIDEQMRVEKEYDRAMQLANRDALTGVKSKYAYDIKEAKLNEEIEKGQLSEFAIVVCDVNDLKRINDNKGHQEGDKYLCNACGIICEIFKHSPVYRVGGDEFVAILTGMDYRNRHKLMEEIAQVDKHNQSCDEAIVAVGMSEYKPGDHVSDVFERADEAMYVNKNYLKDNK